MDINAGEILEGGSIADVGTRIKDLLVRVINGEKTKAEINQQDGILCLYSVTPAF
jgi:altronate dehydratase large subunit